MKKSLLMMGAAIAVLSSCTQNEVLDIADANTIKFGNTHIGKPTRANIIDENNPFNSFYVYGYSTDDNWTGKTPVFENINVYRGENTPWGYDELVGYETGTYAFAAYSDGGILGKGSGKCESVVFEPKASPDKSTLTITDYVTTNNNDLVVSFSRTDINTNNKPLDFTFKHALSKIRFTIQSALGENPIEITGFKLVGFNNKSTLTYTMGENHQLDNISWTAAAEGKTINTLENYIATTLKPAYGEYVVIPQKLTSLKVSFTATLKKADGSTKQKQFTDVAISKLPESFKAGYSYNFVATIDGPDMNVISFGVNEVDGWVDYDANNDGKGDDIIVEN